MCSAPVTFGGGIAIEKFSSASPSGSGWKSPESSQRCDDARLDLGGLEAGAGLQARAWGGRSVRAALLSAGGRAAAPSLGARAPTWRAEADRPRRLPQGLGAPRPRSRARSGAGGRRFERRRDVRGAAPGRAGRARAQCSREARASSKASEQRHARVEAARERRPRTRRGVVRARRPARPHLGRRREARAAARPTPRRRPRRLLGRGLGDERRREALLDRLLGHDALLDVAARGQLELHLEQDLLDDRAQAAGAGLALERLVGDEIERVVGEDELDPVEGEEALELLDERVARLGEDRDRGRRARAGGPRDMTGRRPMNSGISP